MVLIKKLFILGIAVILISGCGSPKNNTQTTKINSVTPQIDNSWIPADFQSWSDEPPIAIRVLDFKKGEYNCGYYNRCFGVMIIAKNGCQNMLYAETQLLDKDKVQIGYTNDSLSSALPMQKNKIVFGTDDKDTKRFQLSKVSCI